MKKIILLILLITSVHSFSQKNNGAFKDGEFLQFKISYGLINAGLATLKVENHSKNNIETFHVTGKGWTTGMTHFFFPVEDDYQTYFHKETMQPYHFVRKINEGGYTKNKEIFFDFQKHQAKVVDHKRNSKKSFFIQNDVQDMLSSLYYLRSLDLNSVKDDEIITINMFFDNEMNKVQLKFKGRKIINTKFGKVKTLIFKPMVQSGRVFKENESVTVWVTDDNNKIPIKIKASILVGSLKAELVMYKGLANSFPIIFN